MACGTRSHTRSPCSSPGSSRRSSSTRTSSSSTRTSSIRTSSSSTPSATTPIRVGANYPQISRASWPTTGVRACDLGSAVPAYVAYGACLRGVWVNYIDLGVHLASLAPSGPWPALGCTMPAYVLYGLRKHHLFKARISFSYTSSDYICLPFPLPTTDLGGRGHCGAAGYGGSQQRPGHLLGSSQSPTLHSPPWQPGPMPPHSWDPAPAGFQSPPIRGRLRNGQCPVRSHTCKILRMVSASLDHTTVSVLTTSPTFYAICVRNHRIITGNVVQGRIVPQLGPGPCWVSLAAQLGAQLHIIL